MASNPHAQALHASLPIGVFSVTGGGVTLLADLLTEPGASASVLEASVPYAQTALAEQIGSEPDRACSEDTARALAMAAFQRARKLAADRNSNELFGFGCTAALATNRKKRGKHRAHLAVQTLSRTVTGTIEFDKGVDGMGDRLAEESQITGLAWQLLEQTLDIDLSAPDQASSSQVEITQVDALSSWSKLLDGKIAAASNRPPHTNAEQKPGALISGSFNPLHKGHLQMATLATQILNTECAFEICIDNVDKPALGFYDIQKRAKQFEASGSGTLWLTNLPTFIEKAREFPGCTFVVGIDTLVRIGMPRYYLNTNAMYEAFAEFENLKTSFLVFGRVAGDSFLTLASSDIPAELRDLCTGVPEDQFRIDLSSSALRAESENSD